MLLKMIVYTTILVSSFSSERRAGAVTTSCIFKVYTVVKFKAGQNGPLFAYTVTSVPGYYLCRKSSMLIRCERLGGLVSPAWSSAALEILVALVKGHCHSTSDSFSTAQLSNSSAVNTWVFSGPHPLMLCAACSLLEAGSWKLCFD